MTTETGALPVVAIDGPGGVGKSTVARRVASRLGVPYLETGAMYRALGLEILNRGVDPGDEAMVASVAESLDLEVARDASGAVGILLHGEALGDRIRDERVAQVTSRVAAYPEVRRRMVEIQRRVGQELGGVIEGRDIGTKVFPGTPLKFFLDADPGVRAERRLRDIERQEGGGTTLGAVRAEMEARDRRDRERQDSPLRRDSTYHLIDTTALTADEVVERVLATIRETLAAPQPE